MSSEHLAKNAKNLNLSFEKTLKKMQDGGFSLRSLEQLFDESANLLDFVSRSLQGISMDLYLRSSQNNPNDTFRSVLKSFSRDLPAFSRELSSAYETIFDEILEPLKKFIIDYHKNSSRFSKEGKKILSELADVRQKAENEKEEYFKTASQLEKAQTTLQSLIQSIEKGNFSFNAMITPKTDEVLLLKEDKTKKFEQYKKTVEATNALINKRKSYYNSLLESMLQLDQSRAGYAKSLLAKYATIIDKILKMFMEKVAAITASIANIRPETDTKAFATSKSNEESNSLFTPLKCIEYDSEGAHIYPETENILSVNGQGFTEEIKQLISIDISEDYFGDAESPSLKEMRSEIEGAVSNLVAGKPLTLDCRSKLTEKLHKPLGRNTFASILEKYGKLTYFESWESFQTFSELIKCLLTEFVKEKDYNYKTLQTVLLVSKNVFSKENNAKVYLFTHLSQHHIWDSIERWQKLIDAALDSKIREVRDSTERQKKRLAEKQSLAKKASGAYYGAVTKKKTNDEEEYTKMLTSSVTGVLQQFTGYMVNYNVNLEKARQLIRKYGKRYKIDPKKLFEMEIELQIPQKIEAVEKKYKEKVSKKHLKLWENCKKNNVLMGIILAIPYLDKIGLRNVLVLNKAGYEITKMYVFRQVLIHSKDTLSLPSRLQVWSQILNLKGFVYDYEGIKQKVALERPLEKSVEGLIHLDVQRSFQSSKIIKPDSLISVLKVYAYANEEVQYCQGMNFVAGFLLLLAGNEEDAFKLMKCVIEKHGMQNLFVQDVPLLKEYFYELDRLVHRVYPKLSEFFRAEGVSTSFFASAWFMTVFTHSMQHVKDDKPTEMVLKVWDRFLVDGWKAVFKASLFIIGELEDKLMESKFDQVMSLFGDVPKGKLMHDPLIAAKFKERYKGLKVTNRILQVLGKEYRKSYKDVYEDVLAEDSLQKSGSDKGESL